jgi:hypothetical protein
MAKKNKVPKRIAGVKLPKPLRRGLRDLARTQNGRTVLTEAVVAAAGLLAAHEAQPGSKAREVIAENTPGAKAKAKAFAAEARSWAGGTEPFQDAARAFTESFRNRTAAAAEHDVSTPPIAR